MFLSFYLVLIGSQQIIFEQEEKWAFNVFLLRICLFFQCFSHLLFLNYELYGVIW